MEVSLMALVREMVIPQRRGETGDEPDAAFGDGSGFLPMLLAGLGSGFQVDATGPGMDRYPAESRRERPVVPSFHLAMSYAGTGGVVGDHGSGPGQAGTGTSIQSPRGPGGGLPSAYLREWVVAADSDLATGTLEKPGAAAGDGPKLPLDSYGADVPAGVDVKTGDGATGAGAGQGQAMPRLPDAGWPDTAGLPGAGADQHAQGDMARGETAGLPDGSLRTRAEGFAVAQRADSAGTVATQDSADAPVEEEPGNFRLPVQLLSRRGDEAVSLRVGSRELGPIWVDVQRDGQQWDVALRAARHATAELLGTHLAELTDGLRARRLEVGQASASFWDAGTDGEGDADTRRQSEGQSSQDLPDPSPFSRDSRQQAAPDGDDRQTAASDSADRGSLNIRV